MLFPHDDSCKESLRDVISNPMASTLRNRTEHYMLFRPLVFFYSYFRTLLEKTFKILLGKPCLIYKTKPTVHDLCDENVSTCERYAHRMLSDFIHSMDDNQSNSGSYICTVSRTNIFKNFISTYSSRKLRSSDRVSGAFCAVHQK